MGINGGHVLGRAQRFFEEPENFAGAGGPAGTMVKATAGGAAKVLNTDFDTSQAEDPRRDVQDGQDPFELIRMKRENSYSVESYVIPSGIDPASTETPPDHANLYLAAWGVQTLNSNVSVVYSLSNSQLCDVLSLHRIFSRQSTADPELLLESMIGSFVNEFKLTLSGGDSPKVSWAGESMRHLATAVSTVLASTGPADFFDTQAGDGDGFEANASGLGIGGSVIQVGADDNSSLGHELTDVTGDTLTSTGGGFTVTIGEAILPFTPAPTTQGAVLSHTLGTFTVDGVTFVITALEFTITRNLTYIKDEIFADGLSDAFPGWRDISLNFTIRGRRDRLEELARRKLFADRVVNVIMGTVAGAIATLNCPRVRFKVGKIDVPDATSGAEGTMAIEGVPLDTAEGLADRATLTFT